jgi:hypothetical protein
MQSKCRRRAALAEALNFFSCDALDAHQIINRIGSNGIGCECLGQRFIIDVWIAAVELRC